MALYSLWELIFFFEDTIFSQLKKIFFCMLQSDLYLFPNVSKYIFHLLLKSFHFFKFHFGIYNSGCSISYNNKIYIFSDSLIKMVGKGTRSASTKRFEGLPYPLDKTAPPTS